MNWQETLEWLRLWFQRQDWDSMVFDLVGNFVGFLLGFIASWFLLIRRRFRNLERLKTGDSDDIIFQAHFLSPVEGTQDVTLLFRNLMPATTIDQLYDNPAAREIVKELAEKTTLENPILPTEGTIGFEVLNDAFGRAAGHLAASEVKREVWLFAMTCEDRQVVRRKCIRCFLIRPADLEKFADWDWCRSRVRCEQPWHWYRIVALHQIALVWQEEEEAEQKKQPSEKGFPLIDEQARHRRVRHMAVGIFPGEVPIGKPVEIPWNEQAAELKRLGLHLKVDGEGEE